MLSPGTNISLFPLNVVLFPGMMLPLHIFEERYQLMIRECIDSQEQTFGVILAKNKQAQAPNVANVYLNDLYEVGTTARITAVEHLQGGRMNLITVGEERFLVRKIRPSVEDFLIGEVDPYPISEQVDPLRMEDMTRKLKPLVEEYIGYLALVSGEDLSNASLPSDPTALAYLAGTAVQGPLPDKQELLSSVSLNALVVRATYVLEKENKIMSYMFKAFEAHNQVQKPPFVDYSLN